MEQKKYVARKESVIYAVAALGQGLVYSCMSSYITDFYVNVLTLSYWFSIFLMLFARVWDAINDPLMGLIVDRHMTRWGRMRPYPVFTAIPIALLTILMFTHPIGFEHGSHSTGLYIYVAAVYVLWGMIYTASDVPFWSLPNVMTPNPAERGNIISYGRTVGGIGSAATVALPIILGFIPMLSGRDDFESIKYPIMAIVMSAIGMPLFILSSFKVKERVVHPNATKRAPGEPSSLKRIFTCKPLMLVVLTGVLSFGRYMLQSAAVHVARYGGFYMGIDQETMTVEQYQGNLSKIQMIIQICTAVGMFGAMVFLPKLFKKFEYRTLMIVSCLGGFGASVVTLLVGWFTHNLLFCIPFMIISAIPLGVINNVSGAMVFDCIDFMEWKTGYRDNALGSACQSFVNKLGNAFASVMILAMYPIVGINVQKTAGGQALEMMNFAKSMNTTQNFGMFSLVTIVPGISLLLCAIPMLFYDIVGDKKKKITEELAIQRKERGIVSSD